MTIVEKVVCILNANKELTLQEIYDKIPEHSKASIRGNINRYLLKELNPKFQRVKKGIYSVIEIFNIVDNPDGTQSVDYISSFYHKGSEVHFFHKDFVLDKNENLKAGFYHRTDEFDSFETLEQESENINSILMKGDVKELLPRIKSCSIDCILTDPPYKKIKGGKNGKNSPKGILKENDGKIFEYNDISFDDWLPECYRILKDDSHAYFFTDFTNLQKMMHSIEKAGFYIHNLLVWLKNNATPNRYYMKNCEYIFFCKKGKAKTINNAGSKTVLEFDNILGNKIHPSEKPIDLLSELVLNSTKKGEWVLDLFSGSESTSTAALLNDRHALSIDIDPKFTENRIKRMKYSSFLKRDIFNEERGINQDIQQNEESIQSEIQLALNI